MGAGATPSQVANGKRRMRAHVKRAAARLGLVTVALPRIGVLEVFTPGDGIYRGSISIGVLRASNGETFGQYIVNGKSIPPFDRLESYLTMLKTAPTPHAGKQYPHLTLPAHVA